MTIKITSWRNQLFLGVLVCFLGACGFREYPTQEQAIEVESFLQSQNHQWSEILVFGWTHQTDVEIFGISEKAQIDSICDSLKKEQKKRGWRPIIIVFADEKLWTSTVDEKGIETRKRTVGEKYHWERID